MRKSNKSPEVAAQAKIVSLIQPLTLDETVARVDAIQRSRKRIKVEWKPEYERLAVEMAQQYGVSLKTARMAYCDYAFRLYLSQRPSGAGQ